MAHRGAGKLAPENTLAAFRLGAQYGYRMFECDVKLSADGVPFLLHDATLERTTNGHGTAGELTWAALSQLDAGSWHSRTCAGEPLPTFEHIARWCLANGCLLDIEIKPTPGQEAETGRAVAEAAQRWWRDAAVPPLLTSFQAESLCAAQQAAPDLPRGLLLDKLWSGWDDVARQLKAVAVICQHRMWDAALVAQVKGMGMRCLSYTVNDEAEVQRLVALGTDGVVTDAVDRFAPSGGA
jgi:glycerophosphoryl diester phosphodiesterase